MRHLRTLYRLLMLGLVLAAPVAAIAQAPPATMPPNSAYGRLGAGTSGPGQAIPFATLTPQLLGAAGYIGGLNLRTSQTSGSAPVNLYTNNSTGSDSNDGLAATVAGGHGPFATINHCVFVARNNIDIAGLTFPVCNVATGSGTYSEQITVSGATIGGGAIQVTGSGSGNVTIQAPSGLYALSDQSWAGLQFSGVSFGCASGAAGEWLLSKMAQADTVSDVKFLACAGAAQIAAINGSEVNFVSAPTFSGNAGAAIDLDSGSRLSASAGFTISGSPTYSTTMLEVVDSYVLFAGASVSGSFTGSKFIFAGLAYAEANGRSLNSVISGGSNGALELGAQDDAGDPATAPLPAATTVFGSLPTPVAGMYAYITDGKASNCGDSACTTWGTTVTGGTGSLKLFVWYNGANWTLAGK